MIINELTGIKHLDIDMYDRIYDISPYLLDFNRHIEKLMNKFGYKFIMSGTNSLVFSNNKNVIKIFKNDVSYEYYIQLIKNIPYKYKSFVPKITSIRSLPKNKNIKFIKLPLYSEIQNTKLDYINKLLDVFYNKSNEKSTIFDSQDLLFIEFLNYLKDMKHDESLIDITNFNIMWNDETNYYVVTDPYYNK